MSTSELFGAFEADTSDTKAFEALVKHLISDDDQSTLATVYEQLPSWAPGDAQNPLMRVLSQQARVSKGKPIASYLHYQNGVVLWKHYDSAQMAEMSFRKVDTPPDDPSLLREFYLDYYVAQNNWRRLEQFMSDPAKGGLDDEMEVKRLLARLAKEHEQPEKAIGFWQGVRTADPTDNEAESNLRDLYVEVGKWHALVDLIKDNLASLGEEDADLQLQFQLELVDIYKNKMNAASKVVSAWQAILDLDPGNPQALDALAGEFEEMKRWPDLVKILQLKVEHETDGEKLIALHERIASIMMERFSNTTEAIKSYEAILELDADNRRAIEILKEIYEQRRDWDNYILIGEREINLLDDGDAKREQFVALARLASERIRRPATPIALWERVLNGDQENLEALEQLEGLYEREKNFVSLAQIIEKRVAFEPDPAAQIALLEKLGMVTSVRLDDTEKSADVWRQLLDRDPTHRKAQAELKKKYIAERDWDGLEWFFRSFGDTSDWVRTLESQAKSVESIEDKTQLLFKAAAIWQGELNETRRAVKNLEAVLALTPQHDDAARMLIPIYEELGNHSALPNVYDIVLEASEDAHERREMHLSLAKIQEEHLKNPEAAFFAYVQAVSETPGAVDLHPELRRLAEASENWESYVFVLQESVEQIADDTDRIDVLLEIGRVYRDQLAAEDTALTFFNRVLAIDEYNKAALVASERAYAQTGAWDQLVLIYEKQLVIINAPEERRDVLFKLAGVWRDNVEANDESEAILREMLGDFPEETSVHDALIQIYLLEERFASLREVLEQKRDVLQDGNTAPTVLADIECELGMLTFGTREKGAGIRDVVDHYAAALTFDPSHEATVTRLEELLADAGQRVRITRILEPVYQNRMAWDKLAQMLEIQHLTAVEEEEREVQIELLTRLSDLYSQRLDDRERAWQSAGRLFALQPERPDVRGDFQRLTGALGRWAELVDLYTANADEPLDKASRIAIKLEVARARHKRLDALEDARVFYHKVLDEEPEHKEALDALEGIYVDLDRAEDLLGIYRRKIELTDDVEQKLDYLFRTSDLLRDRIDNPEDAIAAAREALDLKPGHIPSVQRLDELYTQTGQWSDLARTLEETVALVGDDAPRKTVLEVRLAGVHQTHLEDPTTAIEIYARILESAPGNMASVEALEGLFENEDLAPTIAPILEPHYDNVGDWERLIAVYSVREAASDDIYEKVAWHYKVAELYELLGDKPGDAFEHYAAAASLDPGNEKTLGELLRLADKLDNHGELVTFLEQIVEDILDDRRRIETHRVIARLASEKTQDTEGAETQLRAILELDPSDAEATDTLMALYEQADNSGRLVDMLLLKAPMVHDPQEKHALYVRAGEISASRLDNPEQAIEIYESLLALDANSESALTALEGLYERVEDWDNLVRIYRDKIDRTDDIETKKLYGALMGQVQADRLKQPDDAIATWHRILEWDPAETAALDELDGLYTAQEDWFNLQEILRKKQGLTGEDDLDPAWETAQFRIARLFENDEQLGDVHQAIGAYGALLARNPAHEGSIEALKQILATRDAYVPAFEVLRPVLEASEAHEDLWTQYEVLAKHQTDNPSRQTETLHAMALLAEGKLGDPRRALEAQARAFKSTPRAERAVAELERLAASHGFYEDLVQIYSTAATDADDEYLALDLRLKAGAILMDHLGDDARATTAYRKVYEDFPERPEVLARLHKLYERQGLAKELAEIVRTQVESTMDPAEKIEHLTTLALVAETQLEDTNRAYEAYIEILDLEPNSELAVGELRRLFDQGVNRVEIGDRLDPIYRSQQRWEDLEHLMRLRLDALEEPVDQMQLMRSIAQLNLSQRNDKGEALTWFGQAFRLDPEDEGLHGQLSELAAETGRWEDFKQIMLEGADAAADDERRVTLWNRAATVSREQLGDADEAEVIYKVILEADDANRGALMALDDLYTGAERWAELEPVLVRATELDDVYDDERLKLYVRLAELYRDRLDDREKSIAAWQSVLELNDIQEQALKALHDMYLADENWAELFSVLQRLNDISRSDADRVSYSSDMAQIAETALENPARAIELWEDVLAVDPNNYDAVHELQRLLEDSGNYQSLAETYERELRMGVDDPARRLELHRRTGQLWMERLDDPFQAQTAWQRALEEDPGDKDALDALRSIHKESGNEEALAGVIEASLKSAHYRPEEQLALWRQLAELNTDVFGNVDKGIEAWRAVLKLAPSDDAATAALERLYENGARWDDLVGLYRDKLGHIEDPEERVSTWLLLGTIQQENLQDTAAAAQTYRDILEDEPSHLEASRRLEAIYSANEQYLELAPLLLDRSGYLDDADERLLNYRRLASIYEDRLGQADSAFLVLQRANEEAPEEVSVLAELERLAASTGLWADLYQVYESTLKHLDGIAAVDVMLKSAAVQEQRLAEPLTAIALYERVLEHAEDNETALRALVTLNEQEERWQPLVDAIDGLAELTPDYSEKLTLLKRMATVHEEKLQSPEKAVEAWHMVLDVDELDRQALEALERLHIEREDWNALIDVLERVIQVEPARESDLKLKIAGILEAHLDRADDAIAIYEEVLTFEPSNEIARGRLEALYGEREDWGQLVEVYERGFDAARNDEDRAQMARNIAMLQDEVFQDAEAAADSYQRILTIVPDDQGAFEALERLYSNAKNWDDLINLHESRFETAETSDARADALAAMARIYKTELDDVDNAIGMYERVLLERRSDRESLDALDELYRGQGLWEQVLEMTERKLEVESEPALRVELLCQQGKLAAVELNDSYRSASAYQRVLKEMPGHDEAVDALVAIYKEEERYDKVVETLNHKLDNAESDMRRADIHVDLAEVFRTRLGQDDVALQHLESAVEMDAESRRALAGLADHYMATEAWTKAMPLLELLVDKLSVDEDREELFQVRKRLGLCAEAAYLTDQALDELGRAAQLMPPDRETLQALARLHYKKENFQEAENFLQEVIDKYRGDLSSDEYIGLNMKLGESALKLGHIDKAQRYLQAVVDHEPSNANALGQIAEVLRAHGDWANAVSYMDRLLTLKTDKIERYQLQLAIGDIQAQQLGDSRKAAEAYREALYLDVFPKEPALKLVELSLRSQDFPEAIQHLNRLIKIEDDPKKRAKFAQSAAVLYRDNLNDPGQAIKYFNLTLDNDADNLQAFRTIDELLTKARQWKPLEQNYRRMIERVQKHGKDIDKAPALLFMLYKNLGEIYRSRLKRLDYALSAYELARKQRPNDEKTREILASLYEVTKDGASKAIDHHRFLVQQRPDRFVSYHKLVELFRKISEPDSAWCVAGLLVALGQANGEEQRFYETYLSPVMSEPTRIVDQTLWMQGVLSRSEDPELGRIFELIYAGLGKNLAAQPHKAFGLKKKSRLNLDDGLLATTTLRQVARMFAFSAPEVYASGEPTGIEVLPTAPPVMRLGTDMLSGRSDKELAYYFAKRMTYFHPSHVIATLYGREALDHLYMAAASLVDPDYRLVLRDDLPAQEQQAISEAVAEIRATLDKSAPPEIRRQLVSTMENYWKRTKAPNIGQWHRAVELTADHAALLASGDVALVGQLIKNDTDGLSKLKNSEKLKEFVQYVLSDTYLKLRKQLGVQIDYSELLG